MIWKKKETDVFIYFLFFFEGKGVIIF